MRSSLSFSRELGIVSGGLLLGILALTQACSSSEGGTAATGGTPTGGTATTGGSAVTGGVASGGTATGGTSVSTGGATTGGTSVSTGGATTGGATTGGATTGGASNSGGQAGNTGGGGASGGSGNAGAGGASAGAAGSNAGAGGSAGASGSAGAAGGGAAGKGGAGNGGGGGATGGGGGTAGAGGAGKTAVAMLMPTTGNQLTGTGTFTQNGQNVTLVIQVTNCPAGGHASHIHLNKNCGTNGDDAGGHWVPQGEVIPEITCAADGTGTATVTPTAGTWTIGSGATDVTAHALMVHTGNNANPGGRIACGLINAQ